MSKKRTTAAVPSKIKKGVKMFDKIKNNRVLMVVILLLLVIAVVIISSIDFPKLIKINQNVVSNIIKGDEHIFTEPVSVEYIKNHTGSTDKIDQSELPQALRPFKRYVHPPFSMGACQICHAPKRSKPAAILTATVQELCFECHTPSPYPTHAINCNRCHSPHHSDKKKLIREKIHVQNCKIKEFKQPQ